MIHRILPFQAVRSISLVHTQYCDYCSFSNSQIHHWRVSTQRDSLSANYAAISVTVGTAEFGMKIFHTLVVAHQAAKNSQWLGVLAPLCRPITPVDQPFTG
jgi:hypothetical protein